MVDVRIDDLQPSDAELFSDNESFLDELSEDELGLVAGGTAPLTLTASTAGCVASLAGAASAVGGAIAGLLD